MNPYIFRQYDIRGNVTEDFTEDVVIKLGQAFGTIIKRRGGKKISLSGDVRLTTPTLKENFAAGVLSTGIDVVDIGILPTPANYFSVYHLPDVDGACQITGSHNPPEFNGFKLTFEKRAFFGVDIQAMRELIENDEFESGQGESSEYDLMPDYIENILDKIQLARPMRIAVDCGNAAAALCAVEIYRKLGCEVTELYCDVDGTFPNHHPDPTVLKNLADLQAEIKRGGYDLGIAFDGDADRLGIIDETGEVVWADYQMIVFARDVIQSKADHIVFDVKCSQALEEKIVEFGGTPVMYKTGHSLIKDKMRELKSPFGGEMSGHLFFADKYYGFDDAIYNGARMLELISRKEETLSEMIGSLPKYVSTPEMRLACPSDEEKFTIAEKAHEYFMANYDCVDVDGVRIRFGDGWGLVRASNTQPVIVCRFEAKTRERMEEIQNMVIQKLREFGEISLEDDH
ncbi:MAG: phosphomannomutase/phosphoglucomutase [Candidatus Marinimicrobia bacterium]|nr:phosphomannomutase/phosphoglucomutase [Candidatus Neomarinimicrobiota bacterium]MCF7839405.1 phosphomannomutase/phosphoglucomutase [Candidatus Neomarinimicrobiota bacterium]MCF7902825.1 phosphomannomutase/phosphoglucomutase [Candidatus Neomarinimicrobiota bacterium]